MTTSPKSLAKTLVPVAVIIGLVVGGLSLVKSSLKPHDGGEVGAPSSAPSGQPELKVGATLPDFRLHQFGSDKKPLASELPAKVLLINFWATWCEACMVEMPSILRLRERYKDKGFEVVAVNLDQNPHSVLPRTLKKLGFTFPVYTDPDSALGDLFQIQAIPLSVVIDSRRKILLIESGEREWDGANFRAELDKWLAG